MQASIADVLKNNRLIADAAREAGAAAPLIDVCHELFAEALGLGLGGSDMIAVLRAIEALDERLRRIDTAGPSNQRDRAVGPPGG